MTYNLEILSCVGSTRAFYLLMICSIKMKFPICSPTLILAFTSQSSISHTNLKCITAGNRRQHRRLGGGAQRPNREIVSFRSCVRARGDCQVEMSLKRHPPPFPFPFSPREAFPFPLGSSPSSQAAIQLALSVICTCGRQQSCSTRAVDSQLGSVRSLNQ